MTPSAGATVFTVGHGTRSIEELLAVLHSGPATRVVDVRRFPGSRRHPHLGREPLARALPEAGLSYEWDGDGLGGRRHRASDSRHPAWRNPAFQGYADWMDGEPFRSAIARLEDRSVDAPVAVMCSETLWWRCHRRLVADALVGRGNRVVHLLGERSAQEHVLSDSARIGDDGWPVYDVGVDRPLAP